MLNKMVKTWQRFLNQVVRCQHHWLGLQWYSHTSTKARVRATRAPQCNVTALFVYRMQIWCIFLHMYTAYSMLPALFSSFCFFGEPWDLRFLHIFSCFLEVFHSFNLLYAPWKAPVLMAGGMSIQRLAAIGGPCWFVRRCLQVSAYKQWCVRLRRMTTMN